MALSVIPQWLSHYINAPIEQPDADMQYDAVIAKANRSSSPQTDLIAQQQEILYNSAQMATTCCLVLLYIYIHSILKKQADLFSLHLFNTFITDINWILLGLCFIFVVFLFHVKTSSSLFLNDGLKSWLNKMNNYPFYLVFCCLYIKLGVYTSM